MDSSVLNEIIEVGSYIGLRSPTSSIELFYLVEVVDKGVSQECIKTTSGVIQIGESFLKVRYLEKVQDNRKGVKFMVSKFFSPVYINLAEVFTTNIEVSVDLQMQIEEYNALCQMLY